MSDRELRELEKRAQEGDGAAADRLRREKARVSEGPLWRAADGRILAPHQFETDHLVNALKLMVRRFWHAGLEPGDRVFRTGGDAIVYDWATFETHHGAWVSELEARDRSFDLYAYFRARGEGWCEDCPTDHLRRKKGVRAVGPLLRYRCEPCARRLGDE